jgi:hypothetical protein
MEETVPNEPDRRRAMTEYAEPVKRLLTLGGPGEMRSPWRNYLDLGLTPEHIPELIRMATDPALNTADSESMEVWAPLHAWRTLGQLRAEEAVVPLLRLLRDGDEEQDDWLLAELPRVLGMIGRVAIAPLAEYLADVTHPEYPRAMATEALAEVGQEHPEARGECVGVLTRQLESAGAVNGAAVNGWIVSALLGLDAVESAAVMERAFAAGLVDESIAGGWKHVAWDLGLADEPPGPVRHDWALPQTSSTARAPRGGGTPRERAEARRKKAKKEKRKRKRK